MTMVLVLTCIVLEESILFSFQSTGDMGVQGQKQILYLSKKISFSQLLEILAEMVRRRCHLVQNNSPDEVHKKELYCRIQSKDRLASNVLDEKFVDVATLFPFHNFTLEAGDASSMEMPMEEQFNWARRWEADCRSKPHFGLLTVTQSTLVLVIWMEMKTWRHR